MIIFRIAKPGFVSILFALLMALQLSACSSGGSSTGGTTAADVSLSWAAPAEREDNTPMSLSEIAGYKIYYGITHGQYTNSVDISDGTAENFTFANLPAGTYYIAVTTYDTDGRESQFSAEVQIVV
jgi:hypothetical protein